MVNTNNGESQWCGFLKVYELLGVRGTYYNTEKYIQTKKKS